MEHVRSLKMLESSASHRLSEWEIDLKGCVMRWVEREEIDAARYRIDYRLVEGDMASFEGFWQLEPLTESSSRATVSVTFDIGIPMLSDMLNPVCERAVRDNSLQMLRSVATEVVQKPQVAEPQ
jgi:ribosome-associated toxin RatA of RatAB toxin-antitoxin module